MFVNLFSIIVRLFLELLFGFHNYNNVITNYGISCLSDLVAEMWTRIHLVEAFVYALIIIEPTSRFNHAQSLFMGVFHLTFIVVELVAVV